MGLGPVIRIEVTRDTVSPALRVISERLVDFSEPIGLVLQDGLAAAQEQIVEGKGALFGGTPWPPMAEYTIKKGRDPATLLEDTGALLLSLSRGGSSNLFEVTPQEGRAGTTITSKRSGYPYGMGQQAGARNRPPRPSVAWPEEHLPLYDSLFLEYITGDALNG